MKRIVAVSLALVPLAAAAQQLPATLLMPTSTMSAIRQYLGTRPHDEVAGMINQLEACASVQMPDKEGKPGSGDCRVVSEALAQQARLKAQGVDAAK